MARGHLFNQFLVSTSLIMCTASDGFIFGQMSGMIDELQKTDTSINLTEEEISWMASTINILFIVGITIVSAISDKFGRRKTLTFVNSLIVISWILVYVSYDKITFFISRTIIGVCFGGVLILVFICICEYYPPETRALYFTLITGIGSVIGGMSGHALGVVFNWRIVALIGIIPSAVSALLPFLWEESPAWLASKGKFVECEKAYKALHALNIARENEIRLLVTYEKKKQSEVKAKTHKGYISKKLIVAIKQAYFWKIGLLGTIVIVFRVASCRILFSTLAITILRDITGTQNILFFTLFVDGLPMIGVLLSYVLFSKFKIREIVFTSGPLANIFFVLFALSLYLWPENDYFISWLKVCLLTLHFIIISAGAGPALDSVSSEILPVELKPFLILSLGVLAGCIQSLAIKFTSAVVAYVGYHGLFFCYAIIIFLCLTYFWFFLPETKGRSLHEIEYFFRHNTFNYSNDLFQKNQTDILLDTNIKA